VTTAFSTLAQRAAAQTGALFMLRSADGAIGAHQRAVHEAYGHFETLAMRLLDAVGVSISA
jgi:hypothetical protein